MAEIRKVMFDDIEFFKIDIDDIKPFIEAVQPQMEKINEVFKEMGYPLRWGQSIGFSLGFGEMKATFWGAWHPVEKRDPLSADELNRQLDEGYAKVMDSKNLGVEGS